MTGPVQPQRKPTSAGGPMFLAAALIGVVALAVVLWPSRDEPVETPEIGAAAPAAEGLDAAPAPHGRDARVPLGQKVPSGGTVWVELTSWDEQDPPVLTLDIGSQTEARPLAVTLSDFREGVLVAEFETSPVAAGETQARLTLPAQAPAPGRYLIQVKTTERSHIPLRRYVLEVIDDRS